MGRVDPDTTVRPPMRARGSNGGRGLRGPWFLFAVFAAIAVVVAASFLVYSLQPRSPPTDKLAFSSVALVDGNASFVVESVSGGPYAYTSFQVSLVVNEIAGGPIALAPSNMVMHITIGPNPYRIVWLDSDGDGAVGVGDPFIVSGEGSSLPSLSVYEFDLHWQSAWTAKATWSTS